MRGLALGGALLPLSWIVWITTAAATRGFRPEDALSGLAALATLPLLSVRGLSQQLSMEGVDLIGTILGEAPTHQGRRLTVASRDLDVEEFMEGLPSAFKESSLANLAYLDAGLKRLQDSEQGADLVSIMQVGLTHSSQHSKEQLEDRGRRLLMASDPQVRSLYSSEGGAAVPEEELHRLLYHMSRSLSSTGAAITPTEQLVQLGPQFYPNPLLEIGLADLAIDLLSAKRLTAATTPVLTSNSLLRMGLEHRGNLGPQDLMKRGYKVLEELNDVSKTVLKLEDLTTLRPTSPSLQATLKAISKGLTAYNMGTATDLTQIIDAGAAAPSVTSTSSSLIKGRSLMEGGGEPDEYQIQQMQDLAYALIGLQNVANERGPKGVVTSEELIDRGRQRADSFSVQELVQIGYRAVGSLRRPTRRALTLAQEQQPHEQDVAGQGAAGHDNLLVSLLAQAVSSQQPGDPPLATKSFDTLVSEALDRSLRTQREEEQPSKQQRTSTVGPQDLLKLGLLQVGLSAAKQVSAPAPLSVSDIIDFGAQHQAAQDQPLAPPELIQAGTALLDRVAADFGVMEPEEVFRNVAAGIHQGGGGLRLSSLNVQDLVRLGQLARKGDRVRVLHANTAIEVMQDHPDNYRSHADEPIPFHI